MELETSQKAKEIINALHHGDHIDDMTKKWLSLTANPSQIPVFYTLTKIHKPNPVGRPIISGCEGPTERFSSFVDHLLQPIAKIKKIVPQRYDRFLKFYRENKSRKRHNPCLNGVTSLYTNIPQEVESKLYVEHTKHSMERSFRFQLTSSLREMLKLVLEENSYHFNGQNYLQTHGTAMGTKLAVSFANIFLAKVETDVLLSLIHI